MSANHCAGGKFVEEVAGRAGRPAMGVNLEGLGLGAAAMLHLLLLAIFVTVFFWMPHFGPADGYIQNMGYLARNIGYMVYSAMQQICWQLGDDVTTVDKSAVEAPLTRYLDAVETADEADAKKHNRKLLIVSCVVLAAIFLIMIVIIIVAKARCHRVDWGRMVAYCFGVFVFFCAFELALYFVVIRQYHPMSQMQMSAVFLNSLRAQLLAMRNAPEGTYTPPREVSSPLPDLLHPVLTYALTHMEGLSGPARQLDRFLNSSGDDDEPASAAAT